MKIRNLFVGLVAASFSMIALAQTPIVIKFSHVVAADTPKGKASEFFAKKAAELTKGKAKVEVYANSALYKDKEEMEALQLGAVQMLAPSLAKFGPLGVKEFEAFDFPYIFDDTADLHKITQGPIGAGRGSRGRRHGFQRQATEADAFRVALRAAFASLAFRQFGLFQRIHQQAHWVSAPVGAVVFPPPAGVLVKKVRPGNCSRKA